MGLAGTFGTLTGALFLGLSLSKGIDLGGIWLGLPFFIGAASYFLSGLTVWSIRIPREDTVDD
jgi:hypothetical protein